MTNKVLTRLGTGCALRAILSVVMPFVVLGLCGGCLVFSAVLPLPRSLDEPGLRFMIATFCGGTMLFAFMAAFFGFVFWLRSTTFKRLDAAFLPLGLAGRGYLLNGRQYHGLLEGRKVAVYFTRQRAYGFFGGSAVIRIDLAAQLVARATIVSKDALGTAIAGLFSRAPLTLSDPEFNQLSIYADEIWARGLLADTSARAAVLKVLAAPGAFEIRRLDMGPDGMQLQLNGLSLNSLTPEFIRQCVDDLARVARVAESLPIPAPANP